MARRLLPAMPAMGTWTLGVRRLTVLVGLVSMLLTAERGGAQGLPDLTIDGARLAGSIDIVKQHFKSTDCAVVEGCVATGNRKLLRFDVATPNFGTADVVLGNPADNPSLFQFSPCHGHYHFNGYASYVLYDASGTAVVRGRKQAFCLRDSAQYWAGFPSQGYTCSFQGISVGWADVYPKSLDCQWLDITAVPAGNYVLEVTVNPDALIAESSYANNVVRVPVVVPLGGSRAH
jgi:lysyl oxidase